MIEHTRLHKRLQGIPVSGPEDTHPSEIAETGELKTSTRLASENRTAKSLLVGDSSRAYYDSPNRAKVRRQIDRSIGPRTEDGRHSSPRQDRSDSRETRQE